MGSTSTGANSNLVKIHTSTFEMYERGNWPTRFVSVALEICNSGLVRHKATSQVTEHLCLATRRVGHCMAII